MTCNFLQASDKEMLWVLRASVIVVAAVATVMALTVKSIYILFVLCSDFCYVILFPQFVCVIHFPKTNTYGSAFSFFIGLFLRLSGGEPALNLPPFIYYPYYNVVDGQLFPFRTLGAIIAFLCLLGVSYATNFVFERGILDKRWDVFKCVVNIDEKKDGMAGAVVHEVEIKEGGIEFDIVNDENGDGSTPNGQVVKTGP